MKLQQKKKASESSHAESKKKLFIIRITHYLTSVQADKQCQAVLLFQNNRQSSQLSRFESEKLF